MSSRNRMPSVYRSCSVFLFSGLSLRKASERLSTCFIKRNHVSSKMLDLKIQTKKDAIQENKTVYRMDEMPINIGSELVWLWVDIDSNHMQILQINIFFERKMLVAERFIASWINGYHKHLVSTDGGHGIHKSVIFLKLKHHFYSPFEKSIINERTMQYLKDITECFNDYFPYRRKKKCELKHVKNWLKLY